LYPKVVELITKVTTQLVKLTMVPLRCDGCKH